MRNTVLRNLPIQITPTEVVGMTDEVTVPIQGLGITPSTTVEEANELGLGTVVADVTLIYHQFRGDQDPKMLILCDGVVDHDLKSIQVRYHQAWLKNDQGEFDAYLVLDDHDVLVEPVDDADMDEDHGRVLFMKRLV